MKSWHERLLNEYLESKKKAKDMIAALDDEDEVDKNDIKLINSMIRDMTYIIDWLKTGIMPDYRVEKHQDRAYTYRETFVYGVNGYWDDSMGGFVSPGSYHDQYEEVDERMDKELEAKRREAS